MPRQAPPRKPVSVAIVEDDAVTRSLLSMAIESEPSLCLVAAFDKARPAVAWLASNQPDLLLTDLGLPDGSGLEVIRACARYSPGTAIMVISMSSDEDKILSCIEAGATGYVLKDAGRTDIVRALLDLQAGGSPISPIIARKVLARMRSVASLAVPAVESENPALLTKREAVILELVARGDSYGDVARALSLSVGTVQTHVKNIYGKLSVHSRGAAVFEAQRRGLLQVRPLKSRKKFL